MIRLSMAALSVAFFFLAGCSVSQTGVDTEDLDSNSTECENSGSSFCNLDGSDVQIEMLINTPNPIVAQASSGSCEGVSPNSAQNTVTDLTYCFDVSGVCNEAGLESAALVARTSLDGFTTSRTLGTCQRGRFHVQFQQTFALNQLCVLQNLELELVGKRADGTEVRNASRARQTIGFRVSNHRQCL